MCCSFFIGSLIVYFVFKPKNGSTLISEYIQTILEILVRAVQTPVFQLHLQLVTAKKLRLLLYIFVNFVYSLNSMKTGTTLKSNTVKSNIKH